MLTAEALIWNIIKRREAKNLIGFEKSLKTFDGDTDAVKGLSVR